MDSIAINTTLAAPAFRVGQRVRLQDLPAVVRAVDEYGRYLIQVAGASNTVPVTEALLRPMWGTEE